MKTERDGDEVFAARVGLGMRELDGLERAPDVSADVLRRLGEREAPRRPAFAWLAVVAALLAIAVTTTLVVLSNADRNARDRDRATGTQDPATKDPQSQDPVGPWRLVYELPLDELQRSLADKPGEDLEQRLVRAVGDLQRRLGALAVVTRGDGTTVKVTFANAAAGGVAAARELLENPGHFAMRVVADGDYFADKVRFEMAKERRQLQAWLDGGGRERLQRDPGAIAEYRAANESLRWFVHRVRVNAAKAGSWDWRYVDMPRISASVVAAHAESEWNGGDIPAPVLTLPVAQQFLVELVAINMHERHFREVEIDPTSVTLTTDQNRAGVDYRLRPGFSGAYADFSEKYIGKCCAVIWNDEVLAVPQFVSKITGAGRIIGLSAAQAGTMASILSTPVPVKLRLLHSERDTPR